MYFISLPNFEKLKKIFYLIILLIFSISFNQYYGYRGVIPLDSFLIFNSGYDVLNGYFPFKDYWTVTGPLLDVIQAFIFKLFNVSWFSHVLHASIFNFIIAFTTFYTLSKFELNINYCFFYSLLVSSLAYPISGTPTPDHHSLILSLVGLFIFILALKTKSKFYWFFLPIILGFAFLSKQTPAAYISLIIGLLSIIHLLYISDIKIFFLLCLGTLIFISFFILILLINEISLISFFEQYILFPLSIGERRLDLLLPLEFKRVFLRFKLIYLSLLLLIVVIIKKTIEDHKYVKKEEFLIIISLIAVAFVTIIHQLMTIHAKYIFFIIPILTGFSHIYFKKYFDQNKYILPLLIFFVFSSTIYYQYNYNDNRRFNNLDKINLEKAIDAKIIDKKLNKLKWITSYYPYDPKKETFKLKKAIEIIKSDNRKKIIVTDYQFISVILNIYDYSPNKFWHSGVGSPNKGDKYFNVYRNFFIKKLKENKIEVIYSVEPIFLSDVEGEILKPILDEKCFNKITLTDIVDSFLILKCKELS